MVRDFEDPALLDTAALLEFRKTLFGLLDFPTESLDFGSLFGHERVEFLPRPDHRFFGSLALGLHFGFLGRGEAFDGLIAQNRVLENIGEFNPRGIQGGQNGRGTLFGAQGDQSRVVQHRFDLVDAVAMNGRLYSGLPIDLPEIHDVRGQLRRWNIAQLRLVGLGEEFDQSLARAVGRTGGLDESDSAAHKVANFAHDSGSVFLPSRNFRRASTASPALSSTIAVCPQPAVRASSAAA